jgi:hypothetical protein
MLRELRRQGPVPASTEQMLGALRVMNEASHGVDVDWTRRSRPWRSALSSLPNNKALNADD